MCPQQRFRSALASLQSDGSLCYVWHPCSLMAVFAMYMQKTLVLNYPLSVHQRLVRLDRLPRLICVLGGPRSFHWFCQAAASVFIIHLYKYIHDSSSHAPICSNTHVLTGLICFHLTSLNFMVCVFTNILKLHNHTNLQCLYKLIAASVIFFIFLMLL